MARVMDELVVSLGRKIKFYRLKQDITLKDLAIKIGRDAKSSFADRTWKGFSISWNIKVACRCFQCSHRYSF